MAPAIVSDSFFPDEVEVALVKVALKPLCVAKLVSDLKSETFGRTPPAVTVMLPTFSD
jgi:hypothetical protein